MKISIFCIFLSVSMVYAQDSVKVIKSGNYMLVVKEKNNKNNIKEEIENLQNENKKLKEKNKKIFEKLEECKKDKEKGFLIIYKIKPSTFLLKNDCNIEDIDRDIIFTWKKGRKFTSFLEDNENRLKITGFFVNGKWKPNKEELWISKKCVKRIK